VGDGVVPALVGRGLVTSCLALVQNCDFPHLQHLPLTGRSLSDDATENCLTRRLLGVQETAESANAATAASADLFMTSSEELPHYCAEQGNL